MDYATKSLDDVITEARVVVNDIGINGQAFRIPQTTYIAYFNTALRNLYTLRPDAFINNPLLSLPAPTPIPTYYVSDLGLTPATPLPVDDRMFFSPLVIYIAGLVELGDDEFTESARSAQLLTSFKQMLVAP